MTIKNALTVAAAVAALFAQASFAQTAAPATRADVKAEAKANKTPAGEAQNPIGGTPTGKSTKTRAERKAETRAANKGKQLTPAGERGPAPAAATGPAAARPDVKAETKAAVKAGTTIKAGEGPDAPKK